jgi:hypothetical protein
MYFRPRAVGSLGRATIDRLDRRAPSAPQGRRRRPADASISSAASRNAGHGVSACFMRPLLCCRRHLGVPQSPLPQLLPGTHAGVVQARARPRALRPPLARPGCLARLWRASVGRLGPSPLRARCCAPAPPDAASARCHPCARGDLRGRDRGGNRACRSTPPATLRRSRAGTARAARRVGRGAGVRGMGAECGFDKGAGDGCGRCACRDNGGSCGGGRALEGCLRVRGGCGRWGEG